ncbi:hypothetical protein NDU88_010277 [Pleurodeles waltl]|uniref:Uncharacterized protein n=1 Tax=Pleurodeles waltl TaxID=8319 RepID=A0AAV7PXF8_PLEWA|nr:hypothetical protein NDU88_010277 [Pleurodeles waltl]
MPYSGPGALWAAAGPSGTEREAEKINPGGEPRIDRRPRLRTTAGACGVRDGTGLRASATGRKRRGEGGELEGGFPSGGAVSSHGFSPLSPLLPPSIGCRRLLRSTRFTSTGRDALIATEQEWGSRRAAAGRPAQLASMPDALQAGL